MPDLTPDRPVIGVNVQHRDGALHTIPAGRDWRIDDDGSLHIVTDPTDHGRTLLAVFAAGAWDLVELVYAEEAPPAPAAPVVDTPIETIRVTWDPQQNAFVSTQNTYVSTTNPAWQQTSTTTTNAATAPVAPVAAEEPAVYAAVAEAARRLGAARRDVTEARRLLARARRDAGLPE
jgi:hypothetical protein